MIKNTPGEIRGFFVAKIRPMGYDGSNGTNGNPKGPEMTEIICYVEVNEESPVRWNSDATQYMTADYRWHNVVTVAEAMAQPFTVAKYLDQHNGDDGYGQHYTAAYGRECVVCGNDIPPTGKRGRPAKKCNNCK